MGQNGQRKKLVSLPLALDKIIAGYFCGEYNHQAYPKDPRDTRFERWFRGIGIL